MGLPEVVMETITDNEISKFVTCLHDELIYCINMKWQFNY